MSLLNIYVAAHRALVGVDTACGLLPGQTLEDWCTVNAPGQSPPADLSKLWPIAHAGALLAFRGTALFGLQVFCAASMLPSVDAIEDSMGELLGRIGEADDARHAAAGVPDDISCAKQEVALVGWSQREGAMVATVWERQAGHGQPFVVDQVDRFAAPWESDWGQAIEPRTDHDMLQLARVQVLRCRASYPGAPIGRRLIVAEVTREAIAVRQAGELSQLAAATPDG